MYFLHFTVPLTILPIHQASNFVFQHIHKKYLYEVSRIELTQDLYNKPSLKGYVVYLQMSDI